MLNLDVLDAGLVERDLQHVLDIGGRHRRGQSPGQNVTGKVVQNGTPIVPPPADHFELGEIRLPHLIHPFRWVFERVARPHQVKGRAGDEVEAFQNAVDASFRDEVPLRIGQIPGQLARRLVRSFQGDFHHLLAHAVWNPVPELLWPRLVVCQPVVACRLIAVVPAVEGAAGHLEFFQRVSPAARTLRLSG